MVDQMLVDAREWADRNPGITSIGLENAISVLRMHKKKWELWAVAHEKGIRLSAFVAVVQDMAACRPPTLFLLKEAWRPACRMMMPFLLQRFFAKFRIHR
jgi:hypothetical protein